MKSETFHVKVIGTKPLLQNRFVVKDKGLSKKKKVYDATEECEEALIKDEKGVICQPATHFESSMIKAATNYTLQGKKTYKDAFKGGIRVTPELIPHKIQEWTIYSTPVVIQRARVMKHRPRFDKWELEFDIECIDERISPAVIKQILEDSGKFNCVGDYRPKFGSFDVVSFEKTN